MKNNLKKELVLVLMIIALSVFVGKTAFDLVEVQTKLYETEQKLNFIYKWAHFHVPAQKRGLDI